MIQIKSRDLPHRRMVGRLSAWIVVAELSLMVVSCTVGPDFTAPRPPSVTRYTAPGESDNLKTGSSTSAGQTLAVGDRVKAEWWTLFQSESLDVLVSQAIEGSRTLQSATARLEQARQVVVAASGALYPQVDVSAGESEEKQSAAAFGLTPNIAPLPSSFNLFQVGPAISYTPDFFGGTRRKIEQQRALAEYQLYELEAAYLSLTGTTVEQAINLAAVRAQLAAAMDVIQIDRQNVQLVRRALVAGSVPESDLVSAESQLATDETVLPVLDQRLSVGEHALAVLVGRAPGDWSPPAFDLTNLTLPGELPVSLPSALVHQRPDIQAAEAQLHAASAQVGIAAAQLYPSITLSAGLTESSLNGGALFSPAGLVWSVAAGLTQPIFDGGTREAERRAALAAFKAVAADYQQVVLQAFGQVADLLQALSHDAKLLEAQKQALDMASESVRLQQLNYTKGGIGILSLLDAQRQYQRARVGYIRAEGQRYRDTVGLLVAMGGGWWNSSAVNNNHTAEITERSAN
jgi:NodT family efflux transporter outer membrane factor (OMF) lipoprotein